MLTVDYNSPPAPSLRKERGSSARVFLPLLFAREGQHKSSTYLGGYDLSATVGVGDEFEVA